MSTSPVSSRARRLKQATHSVHDTLDRRIMSEDIFSSRARFSRFLQVQRRFHHDIDVLYEDPGLSTLLPDMHTRRRLPLIAQDLQDLEVVAETLPQPALDGPVALPTALGWLYVAEGSNMGAAVLFKLAGKLGLGAGFGARHLAAHPDGVARHWRSFTAALDAVALSAAQEREVIEAAEAAFKRVRGHVEAVFV